jgi:hypothetical protein
MLLGCAGKPSKICLSRSSLTFLCTIIFLPGIEQDLSERGSYTLLDNLSQKIFYGQLQGGSKIRVFVTCLWEEKS